MIEAFYDLNGVVGFGYVELCAFAARFATSVYGNQEIMASAFYVQGDFPVVTYHDGSYVQTMWSHRCNGDGLAVGHDDGASHAQRVGGGSGGGGYDESVGLVGGEGGAVDGGVDAYHR